jgi:hypothetical protein
MECYLTNFSKMFTWKLRVKFQKNFTFKIPNICELNLKPINQSNRILNRSLLVPKLGKDFLSKNITKILGHIWT